MFHRLLIILFCFLPELMFKFFDMFITIGNDNGRMHTSQPCRQVKHNCFVGAIHFSNL
jgi:hypothetical protein